MEYIDRYTTQHFLLFGLIFYIANNLALNEKHHVMIANINSRGRSNQLFAIAEELLNTNDDYFISFLIPADVINYLNEFKLRYLLEHHQHKYQIIISPPVVPLTNPISFKDFAELYSNIMTNSFYTTYPTLHYYLKHSNTYQMKTTIDDYHKYNISLHKENIIFKKIDIIVGDWFNLPILHLSKMYNISTVVLQTVYHFASESRMYLYESSLISSSRIFNDFPNYPHYSFKQDIQNTLHRFLISLIEEYAVYRFNSILHHEFNITTASISNLFDVFSDSLILKSMGAPISTKQMYTSQKYQFCGFLVPAHLDEDRPWMNNVTLTMYRPLGFEHVIKWMDSRLNIIYVSFGTVVKTDLITISLFKFMIDDVLSDTFMNTYNLNVLWSIKDEIKEEIFGNFSNKRILFESWLPQKELLHHPNIKLFITHGGTSSILESIYAAKPLLFASLGFEERVGNAIVLSKTGCCDYLTAEFNASIVQKQIESLLFDKYHAIKCQELKEMMKFFGGTKKAVHVIEYVIKYGAKNLIPDVRLNDLNWYQRTNIHLYMILIATLLCLFIALKWIIARLCRKKRITVHDKLE